MDAGARCRTVAEIQRRIQEQKSLETSPQRLNELMARASATGHISDVECVWRCCWLRTQGVFYRGWSPQEKGQARNLLDAFEDPALAVEFVRAAVERWPELTAAVVREAALFEAPTRPTVGWLLRFRTDAWAWFERRDQNSDMGTALREALEKDDL